MSIVNRNKYLTVLFLLLISILLFSCGNDVNIAETERTENESDEVYFNYSMSFCKGGFCYTDMYGMAYYTDPYTGNSSVICARPNCEHKRASYLNPKAECDGWLGYMPQFLFMTDENEFYLVKHEYDGVHTKGMFDLSFVRADLNGSNRKVLAELENTENALAAAYGNGLFAFGYRLSSDMESVGVGAMDSLDKFVSGIYLIDVKDGTKKKIREIEEYQAYCGNVHIIGDRLYYQINYTNEYVDYDRAFSENLQERLDFEAELTGKIVTEMYYYDISSGIETCYLKTGRCESYAAGDRQLIRIDGRLKYYKAGMEINLKNEIALEEYFDLNLHSFSGIYIREDSILIFTDDRVLEYMFETGEISDFANGTLNGKEICMVNAEVGDIVYYSVKINDHGQIAFRSVNKEMFDKGDLSKAVKLY